MSQSVTADSEIPVPRHSLGLWLATTLILVGALAYAAHRNRAASLLAGAYLFFVLPMIYGALAWLAEALSLGRRAETSG